MVSAFSWLRRLFSGSPLRQPRVGDRVRRNGEIGIVKSTTVFSSRYPGRSCLWVRPPGQYERCWPADECDVTRESTSQSKTDPLFPGAKICLRSKPETVGLLTSFGTKTFGEGGRRRKVPVVYVEIRTNKRVELRTWQRREVVLAS